MSTINTHFHALSHAGPEKSSDDMWQKIRDGIQSAVKNFFVQVEPTNRNGCFNDARLEKINTKHEAYRLLIEVRTGATEYKYHEIRQVQKQQNFNTRRQLEEERLRNSI